MNEVENKPARQSLTLQASAGEKEYELAYLLTSDITENKIDFEISELKNFIAKNGGDVILANQPEKKRLAYPVKKQNFAFFGVIYFNSDTESLDKIKKALVFYKKVLRYLLLNKETKIKPISLNLESQPAKTESPAQSFEQRLENLLNS